MDFLSQYIWRGYALSHDSAIIEPSLTLSYEGFAFNIWGNFDTDEDKPGGESEWNETDYTFSYKRSILPFLDINVGGIYYELDEAKDSFEIFGGLSGDVKYLNIGFTAYREVSHYPGWWLQFDISRNITLPYYGMNLDARINIIYQDSEDEGAYPDPEGPRKSFDGWQSGTIRVTLNVPVTKKMTISPKIMYSFPLSDHASDEIEMLSWEGDDNFFYGGVGLSYSF